MTVLVSLGGGCRSSEAEAISQITRHEGSYLLPSVGRGVEVVWFGPGAQFGDEDFAQVLPALAKLRDLRVLMLDATEVTDESIRLVAKLPQIENLSVTRTRVTSEGVRELRALPRLRYLYVPANTITDDELEELRQVLPAVRISRRE